ncbi:MAG TPA: hypothetical protein VJK04_01590, partial [Candidatus Paceibacterota bacterium]
STLTLSVSADNPGGRNIYLDASAGATDVEMLRFTANAQTADATLLTLEASSTFTSVEPSVYKLYDSTGALLASAATSTTAGRVAFTNIGAVVPVNTTKTFVIKGDFPSNGSGMFATIAIPASAGNSLFRKGDGTTAAPTVASTIQSNGVHAYRETAILQFVSASIVKTAAVQTGGTLVSSTAYGTFVFKATAKGGALTLPTTAMLVIDVVSGTSATIAGQAATAPALTVSNDRTTNISDGDTVTVTIGALVKSSVDGISGSAGYFKMLMNNFKWTVGGTTVNNTWGLESFKTPDVYLP